MSFNSSMCHVITIIKKRKSFCTSILHGEALQKADKAKYLGVEMTKDLHWGAHIQTTTAKANKTSALSTKI